MKTPLASHSRSIIYLALLGVLAVPFFVPWSLPSFRSPETEGLFEFIENRDPTDGVILLMSDWGPGTKGENEPQFRAVVRHLLRKKARFVVMTVMSDPVGMYYAHDIVRDLAETHADGFRYGTDWVNLGMKTKGERGGDSVVPLFQAFAHDVHAFAPTDIEGRSVADFPIMQSLKTIADVDLVIEISAGELEALDWMGAIQPQHPHLALGLGTMSIVATKMLPYFKSGQMVGLLDGSRGADEYIQILREGRDIEPEDERRKNGLTAARVFVIFLIVIGNGVEWRRRRREVARG